MTQRAAPRRLRVANRSKPLGIRPSAVRFGWRAPATVGAQTAYQLRVASGVSALTDDPLWDSGPVESSATTGVPYPGPSLSPRTRYYWMVCVRDATGAWSAWSDPIYFETGPTEWTADWIGPAGPAYTSVPAPAPVFRTTFDVDRSVERATLHVAVGGTCDLRINGHRVTERALDPAQTDYEERVLYASHEVTDVIQQETNALAIVCGRERYAMTAENEWKWHDTPWQRDFPELSAELILTFADGSQHQVATDEIWRVHPSAIRFDSMYMGEVYDARAVQQWGDPALDDDAWPHAQRVSGPEGEVVPQLLPPVEPVQTIEADSVTAVDDDAYVFDFGEVMAGWARLTLDAPAGTELEVTYGERLADDGTVTVEQDHLGVPFQTDRYVCADDTAPWEPRFTYKGFRYVRVDGLPSPPSADTVTAVVAHSCIDAAPTSEFECSDDRLTMIHEYVHRALVSNHHGIPTDTPAYEKHGWTGDTQITAKTALYEFDMLAFYRKWLADIADAQQPSGEIPPFVPTSDWGYRDGRFDAVIESPNPAWDAAYILIPWWVYRYSGDPGLLATHYEGMKALVSYLGRFADRYIIDEGLGDWFPPGHGEPRWNPPEGTSLTSTAYYYRFAEVLRDTASLLGHDADREAYAGLAERIADTFNDAFFDTDTGTYATGETEEYRQTSNIFPLALGLVPDSHHAAVIDSLIDNIRSVHDDHLDTGIIGTKYLLNVLCEAGHTDVAYRIATQRTYPGWGYWIENGETSLLETWELDARSANHHMFGSIGEWFYGFLAGVRPAKPGFETVAIEPYLPTDLNSVTASVETVRGTVHSAWEQTEGEYRFEVTVPPNTDGVARLPGDVSDVNGNALRPDAHAAVRNDGDDRVRTVIALPAGSWTVWTI